MRVPTPGMSSQVLTVAVSARRLCHRIGRPSPMHLSTVGGADEGDGAPSTGRPSGTPLDAKNTAEEVGHCGLVFLDSDAMGPLITHTLTHERARLPMKSWELHYDEDGMGLLVEASADGQESEAQVLHVADILHRTVFKAASSGELFMQTAPGGKVVSLDMERCWFRDASVDLVCGRTSAKVSMRCYVMKMSRHGKQCMFWPLVLLYGVLQLSSYKKQGSRWVQHEVARWTKWLVDSLGDSQLVRGRQARPGDALDDMSGDF